MIYVEVLVGNVGSSIRVSVGTNHGHLDCEKHPDLYKDKSKDTGHSESKPHDSSSDAVVKRQAATDQFMLERFRKRDRHRVMRR
ncbi:hypothetical protein HAX54_038496 [Datura stramonium]|uniref:Uncharacterized protein n=1 Tax=Datura stramonium TaxID=4076 RepID=A0ABS8SHY6_DATST|nr:hypothetical protein [Datura stramonium]